MRQTLNAAVRWRYLRTNPVADAGREPDAAHRRSSRRSPAPRSTRSTLELGPTYGPLVVFAAETGLRTNEWVALERRDVDKTAQVVTVQRRFADGVLTAFPKTERSRRQRAADRAGARRIRAATGAALDEARVPGSQGRLHLDSTTGAPASGTTRSTPPGSSAAARTTCATRSRPRRSLRASRSSSLRGSWARA